jgi:hypothetical protein
MATIAIFLVAMVAIVGVIAARLLIAIGAFRSGRSFASGAFQPLGGLLGAEDIVIDHERQLAYASLFDRRSRTPDRGAIASINLYRPSESNRVTADLTSGQPVSFGPRGLDLHIDESGTRRLFVVNNPLFLSGESPRIEIFRVEGDGGLALERTVRSQEFVHTSSIAAVGPAQFYVTNNFRSERDSFRQMLDIYLLRRSGDLIYFDGEQCRRVGGPYVFPSGLAVSREGDFLVVAELLGCRLRSFARDLPTGDLRPLSTRRLRGVVKLKFDDRNRLYAATRENSLRFERYISFPETDSPGAVYRLTPGADGDPLGGACEQILATSGDSEVFAENSRLPGISVAAASKETLLIGSAFEGHVWETAGSSWPVSGSERKSSAG